MVSVNMTEREGIIMKKIIVITAALCLLFGCAKGSTAETATGMETQAVTATTPAAVSAESKAEKKEPAKTSTGVIQKTTDYSKKYMYYDYDEFEYLYVDTEVPDVTYKFSDLDPYSGDLHTSAFLTEDNKYIDAVVAEQSVTVSKYQWSVDYGIYYLHCYYKLVGKDGKEIDEGYFKKVVENPDKIRAIRSLEVKITEAVDEGKMYDRNETPYEEYYITYQLIADGEPVVIEDKTEKTFILNYYKGYEEEENSRPYFYDTVKQTKGGQLVFLHDDRRDYYHGTGNRFTRYYSVPVFSEWISKERTDWEYEVTEKGQGLFDAILRMMLYDDVFGTEEFRDAREALSDNEIGAVLNIFYSTPGMRRIMSELLKYFEYDNWSFLNYVDMNKISQYSYSGSLYLPATEEEYLEYYSESNRKRLGGD